VGLTQKQHFDATAKDGEILQWSVNSIIGGNREVGTVDSNGNYTAPASVNFGMNVLVTAADANTPLANFASAVTTILAPGVLTATANPQVVSYSIYLPVPGGASVNFGPDLDYGLTTWTQPTPSPNGGEVSIYVAGMRAQTPYHMRARITLDDGASFTDDDHIFTTGSPQAAAQVTASVQNGQIPQSGIELFDTVFPQERVQAFATDLQGNVIWTYSYHDGTAMDTIQPIKLLPNGHFLVQITYLSSDILHGVSILPDTVDAVREVDLAGNTIREVTERQLAGALAQKGLTLNLGSLHHDVLALDNGHWILLATVKKSFTDLPGYPGTTSVLGDVVIDIDEGGSPVWVWNAFDHLDVNRHPYLFPDWTHSNALLYSSDDHNLLLSMRHQNWIIKIDYGDGQGSGKILWRLGEGGDFKLLNAVDPTDWFYAQHGPNFFSSNTAGVFRVGVMDNGDDREFPGGELCGVGSAPACYSAASVYQVDETAMTATLKVQYRQPPNLYSYFGGDVQPLPNGKSEADFCAPAGGSLIQELNLSAPVPQLVWQAETKGTIQDRAERLPSLYPGVQW
jgi:hypothetical protein